MSQVNENSDLYYGRTYWNDIPLVARYISIICSGNPDISWIEDFKLRFAQKPFRHGLFILCGNGWVEREFMDLGIVNKVTAFDYSQTLLDEAEAQKEGRNIHYFQADVNKLHLPQNTFDLVVNVAGLHHVQYLSRFNYQLQQAMTKNSKMVSFDYVGPSRNQYSRRHWALAKHINKKLPQEVRADLRYPDLYTMLNTDPTEAINSDLIFKAHQQFFSIEKRRDFGGGIAYLLITHNLKAFALPKAKLYRYALQILKIDRTLTRGGSVPNLFSYWVSTPKPESVLDAQEVDRLLTKEKYLETIKEVLYSLLSWVSLGKVWRIWVKVYGRLT